MTMRSLTIRGVGKRFADVWVLREVSAVVKPQCVTAFIGPNGAGKTTLFGAITGDLTPEEGNIWVGEQEITGWPAWKIARMGVARQFQDVRIFGGLSVLDNILVALFPAAEQSALHLLRGGTRRSSRARFIDTAMERLELVGLQDHRDALARNLSFGQQKLLSLARLLAPGAEFLLLDEPTAGLSHSGIEKFLAAMYIVLNTGRVTVALIEHNMTLVSSLAQWVYVLNEGRIAFDGPAATVLGASEVRARYLGL